MVAATSLSENLPADTFSDKLGPVFVKELRQGLRARRFTAPFLIIHALAITIVAIQFALKLASQSGSSAFSELDMFIGVMLDQLLLMLLWLIVGIVMPLTGINALQSELTSGRNVELLVMAGMTRWQIMRGKWLVLCALSGLIMISMLPYMFSLYFSGGVELVNQITQFANIWLLNIVMSAVIIGASGLRHLMGRLLVTGITFFSFTLTSLFALINVPAALSLGSNYWMIIVAVLNYLLVASLYSMYGLQLGRDSLRLYRNPMDPSVAGLIIGMIIFTPVAVGVSLLFGFVGPILALLALFSLTHALSNPTSNISNLKP